ncbi:hypothetical protein [Anaerosporobacter sp.]
MRKNFFVIGIVLVFIIIIGVLIQISENNKKNLNIDEAKNLISDYLNFLSTKDLEGLKRSSTDKWGKNFNTNTIDLLNDNLESAKLINCKITESDTNRVLVYAEVELICYENSSQIGDWIPGKSISKKSFELVKVENEWKINGWGVY